jgi:hypothetical protein
MKKTVQATPQNNDKRPRHYNNGFWIAPGETIAHAKVRGWMRPSELKAWENAETPEERDKVEAAARLADAKEAQAERAEERARREADARKAEDARREQEDRKRKVEDAMLAMAEKATREKARRQRAGRRNGRLGHRPIDPGDADKLPDALRDIHNRMTNRPELGLKYHCIAVRNDKTRRLKMQWQNLQKHYRNRLKAGGIEELREK